MAEHTTFALDVYQEIAVHYKGTCLRDGLHCYSCYLQKGCNWTVLALDHVTALSGVLQLLTCHYHLVFVQQIFNG